MRQKNGTAGVSLYELGVYKRKFDSKNQPSGQGGAKNVAQ